MKSFFCVATAHVALLMASPFAKSDETGWTASPTAVARASRSKPNSNFDETKVGDYTLADPLVAADGSRVTRETWPTRRAELLELFGTEMFGHAPVERPENLEFRVLEEDPHALDGKATRKLVEISFETPHAGRFAYLVQLYLPNNANGPVPTLVLLQFEGLTDPATPRIIERGWGLAILDRTKLATDDAKTFRAGIIDAYSGNGALAPKSGRQSARGLGAAAASSTTWKPTQPSTRSELPLSVFRGWEKPPSGPARTTGGSRP